MLGEPQVVVFRKVELVTVELSNVMNGSLSILVQERVGRHESWARRDDPAVSLKTLSLQISRVLTCLISV